MNNCKHEFVKVFTKAISGYAIMCRHCEFEPSDDYLDLMLQFKELEYSNEKFREWCVIKSGESSFNNEVDAERTFDKVIDRLDHK
jgi:hypothetical protein